MRIIKAETIRDIVKELCLEANFALRKDVYSALKTAAKKEKNKRAKKILEILVKNADIARKEKIAICQDTGMAIVFVDIGQDIKVQGSLEKAINQGVSQAYTKGYLRKSIVADPLLRKNTGDNTPAVIHYRIVPGSKIKITVMAKGFGSENVSKTKMLKPTEGESQIADFVANAVKDAGPGACPPFFIGIGIGGSLDKAVALAKEALLLPIGAVNKKRHLARLEKEILAQVNKLKIGPMGFGGAHTALGVKILSCPTHIAGLPVAVNISCHALRTAGKVL